MRFEWDPAKAAANLAKHHVSFDDATGVFDDPLHRSRRDRTEDGEERWQTLGVIDGLLLLLVAHTFRVNDNEEEVCRIISARRPTKRERREFEDGR